MHFVDEPGNYLLPLAFFFEDGTTIQMLVTYDKDSEFACSGQTGERLTRLCDVGFER